MTTDSLAAAARKYAAEVRELLRSANTTEGKPLSVAEARHARSIVQRIAALLVLRTSLDELYSRACSDAFTAEELGLR